MLTEHPDAPYCNKETAVTITLEVIKLFEILTRELNRDYRNYIKSLIKANI